MKIKCVKQHDATDCAADCIATVSISYEKDISIAKLHDIVGTDIKGTSVLCFWRVL